MTSPTGPQQREPSTVLPIKETQDGSAASVAGSPGDAPAESLKNVCLDGWDEKSGHACILERWHDEPYHRDADGYEWRVPLRKQFVPEPEMPETRRVEGGYVRSDAHPGAGEPDWRRAHAAALDELCAAKDEVPDRPEGEPLADGVRRVVEELAAIDAAFGNREAFDNCRTRVEKIEKAIAQASEGWRLRPQHAWLKRERDEIAAERDALRAEVAEAEGKNILNRNAVRLQRERADAGESERNALRAEVERLNGGKGHSCIVCPNEIRNLLALAKNVTAWDPRKHPDRIDRFYRKLDGLTDWLAKLDPLVDAHFAAVDAAENAPPPTASADGSGDGPKADAAQGGDEDGRPLGCRAKSAVPGGWICCSPMAPCRVHGCSPAVCFCRDGDKWGPPKAFAAMGVAR